MSTLSALCSSVVVVKDDLVVETSLQTFYMEDFVGACVCLCVYVYVMYLYMCMHMYVYVYVYACRTRVKCSCW